MGRGYTREEYFGKVEDLRKARPGIAFSSDFIVGFPGETEADFQDTLSVMEEVRFDSSFSFRFSPRAGTRGAAMAETVSKEEASDRLTRLQTLQARHSRDRLIACVGKEVEVLVEGKSAKDLDRLCGRTPCYKTVNFSPVTEGQETVRRVRIRSAGHHSLSGEEGGPRG
jgi:tRNA-2-methylthio-N6-dimethylallyladenosine synthase